MTTLAARSCRIRPRPALRIRPAWLSASCLAAAGFYWIDNARYWLETCVIMKHTMVYVGTLYNWNTWRDPLQAPPWLIRTCSSLV